jgi:thiol:disulfide interchange protein DsbD
MPEGYYLYRHAFAVEARSGSSDVQETALIGSLEIPAGLAKVDDYFGPVEVYYGEVAVRVPIFAAAGPAEIGVKYQGCADAGLCYPPETRWVTLADLSVGEMVSTAVPSSPPVDAGAAGATAAAAPLTEDRRLAAVLADAGLLTALFLFFLGGVGLAFTPCVLPMVPILSCRLPM